MNRLSTLKQLLLFAAVTLVGSSAFAQYDDVYYNPDTDAPSSSTTTWTENVEDDYDDEYYTEGENASTQEVDFDEYDGDAYDYDEYSGYEFTSRVRRFRSPYSRFDYYAPIYVDQVYYSNPYSSFGGTTVLIYNDPYGFNSFNRFNRYSRYDAWNRFNDPFYYRRGYGANSFGWGTPRGYGYYGQGAYGGYGVSSNPYYCPPTWGANQPYGNNPRPQQTANTRPSTRYSGSRGGQTRTPRAPQTQTGQTVRGNNDSQSARQTTSPRTETRKSRTPRTRTQTRTPRNQRPKARSSRQQRSRATSAPRTRSTRSNARPAKQRSTTTRSTPSRSSSSSSSKSSSSRSRSSSRGL